jgi:hypothetical protein
MRPGILTQRPLGASRIAKAGSCAACAGEEEKFRIVPGPTRKKLRDGFAVAQHVHAARSREYFSDRAA